ncbi:hypothetical protein PMAYCL1PPCAC_07968, partial [Pristionchus mayeri]
LLLLLFLIITVHLSRSSHQAEGRTVDRRDNHSLIFMFFPLLLLLPFILLLIFILLCILLANESGHRIHGRDHFFFIYLLFPITAPSSAYHHAIGWAARGSGFCSPSGHSIIPRETLLILTRSIVIIFIFIHHIRSTPARGENSFSSLFLSHNLPFLLLLLF